MKKLTLFLALIASFSAICQPAAVNSKLDPFTKKYTVTTGNVRITYTAFNDGNSFSIGFSSVGDSIYMLFTGSIAGRCNINKGDKLVFLLDNDSTVSAFSPINQNASMAAINASGSLYPFDNIYVTNAGTITTLINHAIKAVRIYYSGGYRYIDNEVKSSLLPDFVITAKKFMDQYNQYKNKTR